MEKKKLLNIPYKKKLASLREDSFIWFSLLGSFLLVFLMIFLIFLNWVRLPPEIPLFFSRPWGEKQLASPANLWLLPISSFSVVVFNLFLALFPFKKAVLARRLLAGAALVISLLYFLTAYKIIALVN
jgi:hypothetical protein